MWYVATSVVNAGVTPEQLRGRFVGQKWSNRWNPAWRFDTYRTADLDADGRTDLIGYDREDGDWIIGLSTGQPLAGGEPWQPGGFGYLLDLPTPIAGAMPLHLGRGPLATEAIPGPAESSPVAAMLDDAVGDAVLALLLDDEEE